MESHPCAMLYEYNSRTRHGNGLWVALQLCWGVFNDVPSTLHICKEVFAALYYRYFWRWKNASNVLIKNCQICEKIVRWLLQTWNFVALNHAMDNIRGFIMESGQQQYSEDDPLLENTMRPNCLVWGIHLNLLKYGYFNY